MTKNSIYFQVLNNDIFLESTQFYESNKQSFSHGGTESIKKKKGDKSVDRFCTHSIELNQGKYHVE